MIWAGSREDQNLRDAALHKSEGECQNWKKCTLAAVLPCTSLSHVREGRYSGPHKVISWNWTSDCDEMAAIHTKKALSPFTVALSLFLSHIGVKETRCACLSRGEWFCGSSREISDWMSSYVAILWEQGSRVLSDFNSTQFLVNACYLPGLVEIASPNLWMSFSAGQVVMQSKDPIPHLHRSPELSCI